MHGMMSERSRAGAEHVDEDDASTGPLLREWLSELAPGQGVPAAAFDTRVDKPEWLSGAASKGISEPLRKAGFRVTLDRGSFIVEGTEGPLRDGRAGAGPGVGRQRCGTFGEAPA